MGWKDWPYWLKGGLIGLVFALILVLIALIPISLCGFRFECIKYLLYFLHPGVELYYFYEKLNLNNLFHFEGMIYVLHFLGSFVIGLIIGWIYGKFKSKK